MNPLPPALAVAIALLAGSAVAAPAAAPADFLAANARAPGGQFVLHAKALPGNPYDGHTLRSAIEDTERLTGREIERAYVDKGYRGHDTPNPHNVFISGQKRDVFAKAGHYTPRGFSTYLRTFANLFCAMD